MNQITKTMRENEEKIKSIEEGCNNACDSSEKYYELELELKHVANNLLDIFKQSQAKLINSIIEEVGELEKEHGYDDKDRYRLAIVEDIKTLLKDSIK